MPTLRSFFQKSLCLIAVSRSLLVACPRYMTNFILSMHSVTGKCISISAMQLNTVPFPALLFD